MFSRYKSFGILAFLLLILSGTSAFSQDSLLTISGEVKHPMALSWKMFKSFPGRVLSQQIQKVGLIPTRVLPCLIYF